MKMSFPMRVKTFVLFFFLLSWISVRANGIVTVLFYTSDGQQIGYSFDDMPKYVFKDNNTSLYLTTKKTSVTYKVENLRKFTFSQEPTGIEKARVSTETAKSADGILTLAGYAAGTPVRVYDSGGKMVATAETSAQGMARLSLRQLPKGVYLVKADKVSLKILR
jgi:hypothetical protein